MAKYRVETTNGTYEVETEEPSAPRPVTADTKPPKQPEGSAVSRFAGGLWDTTLGGLSKAAKTLYHLATPEPGGVPNLDAIQDLHDVVQSHIDQARKAKEEWDRGNKTEAVGHGMAAALPLVGPAAAHAGERIGGEAPRFDKYGTMIDPGKAPDIAGGLGEAVGVAASSSPKNIVKPAVTAAATALSKVPIPHRLTPKGLYQSALRPGLSKKNIPKIDKEVDTGLREGVPVDRGGLKKVDATIDDLNAEITGRIGEKSGDLGPDISPRAVASRVRDSVPTFEEQVNPNADLSALNRSKQEFLDKHTELAPYTEIAPHPWTKAKTGGEGLPAFYKTGEGATPIEKPLTLVEAQKEKVGTYRQLRKKYGELGSADVEAQKALARGLKEEIVKRVPELEQLNAREGALIDLQAELERMVAREGNKNVLGLVPATMAHNPYGFLATLMMDNPAIKSRIAIALNRVRGVLPSPPKLGAAVSRVAPAANIGNPPPPLESPR